jgi:hypothetical protein
MACLLRGVTSGSLSTHMQVHARSGNPSVPGSRSVVRFALAPPLGRAGVRVLRAEDADFGMRRRRAGRKGCSALGHCHPVASVPCRANKAPMGLPSASSSSKASASPPETRRSAFRGLGGTEGLLRERALLRPLGRPDGMDQLASQTWRFESKRYPRSRNCAVCARKRARSSIVGSRRISARCWISSWISAPNSAS